MVQSGDFCLYKAFKWFLLTDGERLSSVVNSFSMVWLVAGNTAGCRRRNWLTIHQVMGGFQWSRYAVGILRIKPAQEPTTSRRSSSYLKSNILVVSYQHFFGSSMYLNFLKYSAWLICDTKSLLITIYSQMNNFKYVYLLWIGRLNNCTLTQNKFYL